MEYGENFDLNYLKTMEISWKFYIGCFLTHQNLYFSISNPLITNFEISWIDSLFLCGIPTKLHKEKSRHPIRLPNSDSQIQNSANRIFRISTAAILDLHTKPGATNRKIQLSNQSNPIEHQSIWLVFDYRDQLKINQIKKMWKFVTNGKIRLSNQSNSIEHQSIWLVFDYRNQSKVNHIKKMWKFDCLRLVFNWHSIIFDCFDCVWLYSVGILFCSNTYIIVTLFDNRLQKLFKNIQKQNTYSKINCDRRQSKSIEFNQLLNELRHM